MAALLALLADTGRVGDGAAPEPGPRGMDLGPAPAAAPIPPTHALDSWETP
jgi:hypothetical protein